MLGLAGCASTPPDPTALDSLRQATTPANWLNGPNGPNGPNGTEATVEQAPDRADPARWWDQLGDASLTALVTDALARNTDVRTAQANLRRLRAVRQQNAAALWPSLDASASAGRSRSAATATGRDSWSAGLDASWEIDLFGANRAGVDAAEADVLASAATLEATRVSLAAEVALAYVQLRSLQVRLATASRNLAAQTETWQITDWRRQAGLIGSVEAEQARADLETTRAQIPTLQTSLSQTETTLAQLLGRPVTELHRRLLGADPDAGGLSAPGFDAAPGAPANATSGPPAADSVAAAALPALPARIDVGVPAAVLARRPDLLAAERQVQAEAARRRVADAARYPRLSLSAALGRSALTLDGLGQSEATTRSLVAQLTAPLFDAGLIRQRIEAQDAVLERARIAYEAALLAALRDVEDALASLRGSRQRVAALGQAAASARNAALLARQQYSAGVIDFQTVLSTQRAQLSAEDGLNQAQADQVSAVVRLYKALGGGWTPGPVTAPRSREPAALPSALPDPSR